MKKLISVAVLLALTSCATTPLPAEQADPVPAKRLHAFQQQSPDSAVLVVTRDKGFTGSACNTLLMVDGQLVAEIASGETARFYIPAGDVILGMNSTAMCGGGLKEREVKLVAGKMKRYRISIDTSMSMDLSPTAM